MGTQFSGHVESILSARSSGGYILKFGQDVFEAGASLTTVATDLEYICSAFGFPRGRSLSGGVSQLQTSSMMYSKVNVGIGTNDKTKIKIHSGITYTISSIFYRRPYLSPLELEFTAIAHDISAGKEAQFIISLQADGTATITKGIETEPGLSVLPDGPAGEVVCAGARISSAASGFTAGTTELDDTDLTVTYTDYGFLPQVSSAGSSDTIWSDGALSNDTVTFTRQSLALSKLSFYYILIGQ